MKQYYCQSCDLEKHEPLVCHGFQLRWELEELVLYSPILRKIFGIENYSYCPHFGQVKLEEEE